MSLKKSVYVLLTITFVTLAFMAGYFFGRSNVTGQVQVLTEYRPSSIGTIELNSATIDELMLIPGIDEVMAQRIVDYRSRKGYFKSVEDLCNISGISAKKLDEIRNLLRVD